jgi:hypothetical protein
VLVDAKGVSRLVNQRVGLAPLIAFALVGTAAIVVAILASPALRNVIASLLRGFASALGL